MKKVLFINAKAGRARRGRELDLLLAEARKIPNLEVHQIEKDDNLPWLVKNYLRKEVKIFGAAGGDGTINSVASCLVNTGIPLVVVPFGTLNHFARDIGAPTNPVEAVKLFDAAEFTEKRIDVGEVNGYFFLNNSSIGIYPRLVKLRERNEKRLGKAFAYLLAGWQVMRRPNLWHVRLDVEGKRHDFKVGLLFFSNNRINMTPLKAGQRARLDAQVFDAYLVRAGTFFEFFKVANSFLRNRLEESPLVTRAEVCEAVVYSSHHHLRVAFDGETRNLRSPLQYKIHPAALTVRVLPEKAEKLTKKLNRMRTKTRSSQQGSPTKSGGW